MIWADESKETCFDYESDDESSERYPFLFLPNRGEFLLCEKGDTKLKGSLGRNHDYVKEERVNVYTYTPDTLLNITRVNETCLRMEWSGISSVKLPLCDCFVMKDDGFVGDLEWFGAQELYRQTWPLNNVNMSKPTRFLPQDYLASDISPYQSRDAFGPVLHPLWLASNGVGIIVDQTTPLNVSITQGESEGELCLYAVPYALECIPNSFEITKLQYTVCIHESIAETAKYFLSNYIPHPKAVPARETFDKPIWSTWGAFKNNIDDSILQNYLTDIQSNGFNISQLEIDDRYEGGSYGNLSMVINTTALSNKFEVPLTAWVHPFVSPTSDKFESWIGEDYFLPGKTKIEGDSVSLVRWWHGYAAVVNFLDQRVATAHRQTLTDFMNQHNLASLKFDAGEVTYLPKCVYTRNVEDPAAYTTAYAAFVGNFSEEVSSRAEVRVGYFSQEQGLWVRMLDRSSTWGVENGLKSVLTTALTFGIAGYPFVLADMIGGNGANPGDLTQIASPDPILFVRWMQLNTFLPVMQFSVAPFNFSDFTEIDVVQHALELTRLHSGLTDTFYNLSLEAMNTGYPIVRPLWWLDDSRESILVDDQFLIGDDIMVAPVLIDGLAVSQCVYFPRDTRWTRYGHEGTTYPDSSESCQCKKGVCEHGCLFELTLSEFLYFRRVYS